MIAMEPFEYPSSVTGTIRRCSVYKPDLAGIGEPSFLLVVLHGIGGDEHEWERFGNPAEILDELISKGVIPPLIAVFPNGRASVPDAVPEDPFEPAAVEGFSRFGDELLRDILPIFHTKYAIPDLERNRAICGLSMGGGQALTIGLGNPGLFSRIAAFSAAPNAEVDRMIALHSSLAPSEWPPVWLCCGLQDELLEVTQGAEQSLVNAGIDVRAIYIKGGHDWAVWKYGFRHALAHFWKEGAHA